MTLYRPRKGTKRKSKATYADLLWSHRIRERDQFCQMASEECWGPLEAAHFHRRGIHSTRWNLSNGALLCRLHHGRFDADDAMKWAWVAKRIGPDELHALTLLVRERWDKDTDGAIDRLKAGTG